MCTLLGCDSVRLYHDNCVSRAPGSRHTRWHCDDGPGEYMAMLPDTNLGQQAVTVWYPLQGNTGVSKGSLVFASLPDCPIHGKKDKMSVQKPRNINAFDISAIEGCPEQEQSDDYDSFVSDVLQKRGCTLSTATYDLGDISVHYTDCFHTTGPNLTNSPRMIIGVTYFADGTFMRHCNTENGAKYEKFCPGVLGGKMIASKLNPQLPHCHGF